MHIPQKQPVCIHCYYRHLEPRPTQLTTTLINPSAGFPPPSGTQQPGGYQIPPQHLYSRGGGHWPSSNPSLLPQQGSAHHSFTSADQPTKYIHHKSTMYTSWVQCCYLDSMLLLQILVIFPGIFSRAERSPPICIRALHHHTLTQ